MTYRDRREARAERLRGWADSREQKSEAAFGRADQIAGMIPFGQPILVGHHSEGRARKDQQRIENGIRAGIESGRMAESMRSRADEIDRQAKRAVYSDDPDAVERLGVKLAELDSQRETMKARNADYRKEHRAELKAMSPYQRGQAVPYPSYAISNLGGTITRTRQRIEQLQRAQVEGERPRVMLARFESTCNECGETIDKGETIHYYRAERRAIHAHHAD
jgi:hypothetical protein